MYVYIFCSTPVFSNHHFEIHIFFSSWLWFLCFQIFSIILKIFSFVSNQKRRSVVNLIFFFHKIYFFKTSIYFCKPNKDLFVKSVLQTWKLQLILINMADDEAAAATTEASNSGANFMEQSYILLGAYTIIFLSKFCWSLVQRSRA